MFLVSQLNTNKSEMTWTYNFNFILRVSEGDSFYRPFTNVYRFFLILYDSKKNDNIWPAASNIGLGLKKK